MTLLQRVAACCALLLPLAAAPAPNLPNNAWNLVFVPSFETAESHPEHLSVEGLNHSLLFGQLLATVTAGLTPQLRQINAWATPTASCGPAPEGTAALQSIEPYALLNNLGVNYSAVGCGGRADYNSAAYWITNLLANQPQGIYVFAMRADSINALLPTLLPAEAQSVSISGPHQYAVVTIAGGTANAAVFDDGLTPKREYPKLDLSDMKSGGSCPQTPTQFKIQKPAKSPFALNRNQTVSFIRHVEAHPNDPFENGNYVCAGQWRALGANKILKDKIGGLPDHILTTNPKDIIGCSGSCSYIRPTLTIEPFAVEYDRKVDIAEFPWSDAKTLAAALFTQNSPFSRSDYANAKTLVAWEHVHIDDAIRYLISTIYQAPDALKKLPSWSYTDYDTIWTIRIDDKGDLYFSNDCEGLDTARLPSTCPAFTSARH